MILRYLNNEKNAYCSICCMLLNMIRSRHPNFGAPIVLQGYNLTRHKMTYYWNNCRNLHRWKVLAKQGMRNGMRSLANLVQKCSHPILEKAISFFPSIYNYDSVLQCNLVYLEVTVWHSSYKILKKVKALA